MSRRKDIVQVLDYKSSFHARCGTIVGEPVIGKGWWCTKCEEYTHDLRVPVRTFINGRPQEEKR